MTVTPISIKGFRLWQTCNFDWLAQVEAQPEDFCEDYEGTGKTPREALGMLIEQIAADRKVQIVATYYPSRCSHTWPILANIPADGDN